MKSDNHYENTPIQIYGKFHLQKLKIFQIKNSDIFHISAQNIDCGYSVEPPLRGGSNEYPSSMFLSRNKTNNEYPCKPHFYYINCIGMFSWWKPKLQFSLLYVFGVSKGNLYRFYLFTGDTIWLFILSHREGLTASNENKIILHAHVLPREPPIRRKYCTPFS